MSANKNIALMVYGQFRSYKRNLRRNIEMLRPIWKTHNVHVFILTDKLESGNFSEENEQEIRSILNDYSFQVHFIRHIEDYDNTEENETANHFFHSIHHERGTSQFAPRLIYREYFLNQLKNEYLQQNGLSMDLTVYCRLFDIKISNNLSFNAIEEQINSLYTNPNTLFGSSDTFFIGSQAAIDYLFHLAMLFKQGKPYHDTMYEDDKCVSFISSMDICLYMVRATYSPELQYISHMFYSNYHYKNMRVDFNNPDSPLNKNALFHVLLDPYRK
jgi:hypothetical protein